MRHLAAPRTRTTRRLLVGLIAPLALVGLVVAIVAVVGTSTLDAAWRSTTGADGAATGPGVVELADVDGAGDVPDGTAPFDEDHPGIANLDADLLRALRHAA